MGLEGIVSKRLGSTYRSGRSRHWIKSKNPAALAVSREGHRLRRSGQEDQHRQWGRGLKAWLQKFGRHQQPQTELIGTKALLQLTEQHYRYPTDRKK